MSIVDSRVEREAAATKLAGVDDDALRRDLAYWVLAAHDHAAEYRELVEQQQRLRAMHAEAETWTELIAAEMRGRRERAR